MRKVFANFFYFYFLVNSLSRAVFICYNLVNFLNRAKFSVKISSLQGTSCHISEIKDFRWQEASPTKWVMPCMNYVENGCQMKLLPFIFTFVLAKKRMISYCSIYLKSFYIKTMQYLLIL